MKFWSYVQMSSVILFFMSLQAVGAESDFKKDAERLIPNSHMIPLLTDLNTTFQSILEPKTRKKFDTYFEVMFGEGFPEPKHTIAAIINGYRCLYVKMRIANTQATEQEIETDQLKALNDFLALHKNLFAPDLAKEITGFGCVSCKNSAKADLGISGEHSSY